MPKNKKISKFSGHSSAVKVAVILILVAIIVFILFILTRQDSTKQTAVNNPVIKTSLAPTNHTKTFDSKGSSDSASFSSEQNISGRLLISPYGTFVSNHYPSLSGTGAPSQEESVCTTNPGVSCYIEFKKDNIVKKLPAQITGSDGTTLWEWDVQKNGFTVGNWTITAVASSGSSIKTRQDSLMLQVSK